MALEGAVRLGACDRLEAIEDRQCAKPNSPGG
jgi:hypothetical protein